MSYQPKKCVVCSNSFEPLSSRAKVCPACRPEYGRTKMVTSSAAIRAALRAESEASPLIPCACGCGKMIHSVKKSGGERIYAQRHGPGWRFNRTVTRQERLSCPVCGSEFVAPMANERKYCSQLCYWISIRNEDHPMWKGGITKTNLNERRRAMNTPRYRKWRLAVLEACGCKCVECCSDDQLHAHHVKGWIDFPALRYVISIRERKEAQCRAASV